MASGIETLKVKESGVYYAKLSTVCGSIVDSSIITIRYKPVMSVEDTIKRCTTQIPFSELNIKSNLPYTITDENGIEMAGFISETKTINVEVGNDCGSIIAPVVVVLKDQTAFWTPNSFTPNQDAFNLRYEIVSNDIDIESVGNLQ